MRRFLLILLVMGMLVALVGCDLLEGSDRAKVQAFAEDWLRSKNMNPQKEDGSIDWGAAGNLAWNYLTQDSGNEVVNAVLGAYELIDELHQADSGMDGARRSGDVAAMDRIIAENPDDWGYRVTRAAVALQLGDMATYQAQTQAAEGIRASAGVDPTWFAGRTAADLESAAAKLSQSGFTSTAQCQTLYEQLNAQYTALYQLHNLAQFQQRAEWAAGNATACQ